MSKIFLYVALIAMVFFTGCVSQGNYDELNAKYTQLQQEKTSLESENDRLDGQVSDLQSEVQSLEAEKTSLNSQISSLQSQATTLEAQVSGITDAEEKLDSARQKLDALKNFNTKFGEGMTVSDMVIISNKMEAVGGSIPDKLNTLMDTDCDAVDCQPLINDLRTSLLEGIEADLNDASSAMQA